MGLQGYIGFGMSIQNLIGFEGLRALAYLLLFILLVALLGKLWCGFICPFGLLQDWITYLRRFLKIPEGKISPPTLKALGKIKYILLAWLMVAPVFITAGLLPGDLYLPFCSICPGKPILPLFAGEVQYFAIDKSNAVTLVVTFLSVFIAGATIAGVFLRPRLFCTFCPLLALIHILKPLNLPLLKKDTLLCHGCGTCARGCPMDVNKVYRDEGAADVQTSDCINCGECVASCPAEGSLSLRYLGKKIVASNPEMALGKRRVKIHGK
jgi:polyferredoxin